LAASASVATTTRTDGAAAAVASVLGEIVYAPGTSGSGGAAVGIGHVAGALEDEPGIGSLRLRARGWAQPSGGPSQLSLTVESTRFLDAWYSDVVASVSRDDARIAAGAWFSVRLSRVYGSTGAASASLQYFVTRAVAFELAGGSYLRDPFQALPQAGFASAGLRIHTPRRAAPPARARPAPQLAPLVAQRRPGVGGDTVFVRFRMDARRSLAIAGDWNAWEPIPLRPLGDDIWEAALVLRPGAYHFNLFVDETEWVVPGGVAVVSDGMGGLVAVLTVL
ncbi:MAG: glycogen-binding domain-containing protein, partial [Gemmatimonadales bacterium]|nr:glycogen-binding domain-containing protein [Gemmatimonadales bacterium]